MRRSLVFLIFCLGATAHAANWYVDPQATGTHTGTSWATAWTSFSSVQWGTGHIVAGDTLYLSGGSTSQTYTTRLTTGASGTAANPITISVGQDAGHNGQVIIDGQNTSGVSQRGIDLNANSYITVTGNVAGANNLIVKNFVCSATDRDTTGGAGIWLGTHDIIDHVELNHVMNGIYYANTSSVTAGEEVTNCYIHDVVGDYGIRITGYTGTDFLNAHIHDSTILTNGNFTTLDGGPDGVQCLNGMTLHDNIIRSVQGTIIIGQHADGIQAMGSYHKIYNNYFANHANSSVKAGPISGTVTWQECYIWNNIFTMDISNDNSGNLQRGLELMPDGATVPTVSNILVCDNTFVDINFLSINGDVGSNATSVSGVTFKNNIFYNCGRRAGGSNFIWNNRGISSGFAIDYNLFNKGADGDAKITVNGSDFTQAHPRSVAPTFYTYTTRTPGNDFHLSPDDTGATILAVDLSGLFSSLTTDKDGLARVVPWDIGAYRSGSSGQDEPLPPSNLHVVPP